MLLSVGESALVRAAQLALATGDYASAFEHLNRAVAAGGDPLAHQILGGALFFEDDLVGARRQLELAYRAWKDAGESRAAALVAVDLADLHWSGFGNRAAGHGWISRARRLLASEGRCVEQGYVELAFLACEDDVSRLEQAAAMVLDLAVEFGDTDLEVLALADSGYALVVQGRGTEGFARLDEAMAALSAGEVSNPGVAARSYCAMLSACDRAGDLGRSGEWTRVIAQAWLDPSGGRPRGLHSHCRLAYGSVLCTSGSWAEGEVAILEVLAPSGTAFLAHRGEAAARLASLRLLQGRVQEAAELLGPFEDRPGSCEPLARLHLLAGDVDLADVVAHRGLNAAGCDRLRASALRLILVEVELARDDVDAACAHAEALRDLAEAADSRLLRAEAALASGRVAAARLAPEVAISRFEEACGNLHPNERPLLAGTLALELAQVLADTGERGAALYHARAAVVIFERLGAALLVDRTVALLRSLGARRRWAGRDAGATVAGLTAREQQVLALVREGLTNAEIGHRLFISAKTAEHHVGRLLAKLGVRSRAEAASVATAAGLLAGAPVPN